MSASGLKGLLAKMKQRSVKERRQRPRIRPPENTTVLIVDDSRTAVHLLKQMLTQGGYRTMDATNGMDGIDLARQSHPDLILMDVVMPGLNGFQATRQLSRDADTAGIPVIIVTTKDQETDRAWGIRQGAKEYIVKPVAAGELLNKIKSLLG